MSKHERPTTARLRFARGAAGALIMAGGVVLMLPSPGNAAVNDNRGNKNDKQTICHATNSDTNPYVVNTPNKNGDVSGHADHTGPIWDATLKAAHISWGDIIPPFAYNDHGDAALFPGLNWSTEGQAIFNNGCVVPTGGGTTGGTTGVTTGVTTGIATTGETTTGATTTGATTTGETTTGATTGIATGTTGGGGGSAGGIATTGNFTGGGTGLTTLPQTGFELPARAATGATLVFGGLLILLLSAQGGSPRLPQPITALAASLPRAMPARGVPWAPVRQQAPRATSLPSSQATRLVLTLRHLKDD